MPRPRALALAALALSAVGCGGDAVRVSGQLVKDGRPYTARLDGAEPETFAVDLVGTVDGRPFTFAAAVGADGRFTVPGSTGAGVPRGRYKVTVLHSGFLGAGGDRFKGRFAADKTPLAVDLADHAALTVDVGAGTVTVTK